MKTDVYTGPDPDHDELVGAARAIAEQIGLKIQPVDQEAVGLLLVHRDASAEMRAKFIADGAAPIPGDGTLLELIDGHRLSRFGIGAPNGELRVMLITKLSCRCVALDVGTDEDAAALGRSVLGGAG